MDNILYSDVLTRDKKRLRNKSPLASQAGMATPKGPGLSFSVSRPTTATAGVPPKRRPRPPAVWGKAEINTTNKLAGAVDDVFMFNCRIDVEVEDVQRNLTDAGISLRAVKLRSRPEAPTKSFIVSPTTQDDYDKIMSGDCVPQLIRVRKYVPLPPWYKNKSSETGNEKQSENNATSASAGNK